MKKLAMLGAGNMAGAIIGGLLKGERCLPEEITVSASTPQSARLLALQKTYGISPAKSNQEAADGAELVMLAVKPQFFAGVLAEIAPVMTAGQVLISLAPGKTMAYLAEALGGGRKVVRAMPNTPAMVGAGMTGYCCNQSVTEKDREKVAALLEAVGFAEEVSEEQMDAVVAVSGSSPAYIFILIEAMADQAVAEGLSRDAAYRFAARAVLGSARLLLESGKHPGELKDMVCSPAGTTIEAVRTLEENGFRAAVEKAMKATAEKSRRM